ncbi:MAG: phosphoenolpyruvate--protein phosphotransferase [Candidatus Delongbacteria bacterium]|nr:phosphoenolpyruvate--protein phosphotransferase [Candidatus Delongbacteria bacterium]
MPKLRKEKILKGVPASPGISIGTPFHYVHETLNVSRNVIEDHEIEQEIQKYRRSIEKSRALIIDDKKKALKNNSADAAKIFDAHLLILDDVVLIDEAISIISNQNVQASYAVSKVMKDYQTAFENLQNEYFSQRAFDVEDVCRRIISNIIAEEKNEVHDTTVLNGKKIIITKKLFPSDTLNFDREHILGIITEYGGSTSHAAIMARGMAVPAIVGVQGIGKWIDDTSLIIVDGYTGKVIINPTPTTFEVYKKMQHAEEKQYLEDLNIAKLKSETLDKHKVSISCNIQTDDEVESVLKWSGEGIGLFRTEFLFESSLSILSEEEQYRIYDKVSKDIFPNNVIIRLLDIGGDKLQDKLRLKEDNPFLGVRGLRLLFDHPDILRSHLRAILRASHRKNIWIIIPFVTDIYEVKRIKGIIGRVKNEMISEGYNVDKKIKIGIMLEIPSVVMIVDHIAPLVDFFSIGTNDLTQYTLAADRGNEKVSHIFDSLHPAVIQLIKISIESANKHNKYISLCGQMAAYPIAIPLLLGLGLRNFSVTPFLVPVVKKIIRRELVSDCEKLAEQCLQNGSGRKINKILSDFFTNTIGERMIK